MPNGFATGDGYWLGLCLLLVLLGLYLQLLTKLILQLRHSKTGATMAIATPSKVQHPKLVALFAGFVGLLCLLPLADYWSAGYSGYHSIGGLLPYSDAADWLHGALHLATLGELNDWAARRPLNAVFLSGLLHLSDTQIPVLLIWRALLLAAAVACWCAELQRQMPRLPALFSSSLVVVLAYPYLPVLLSESQGLLFGVLGFTLLLRGVTNRQLASYGVGAGLVACALMLRMGAFGVLLGLLVWPLTLTRAAGSLRWLLVTALSIGAGIGLSLLWGSLVYSGDNSSASNFSYTLYGLAHGGAPWQLFFEHYPQALQQPEATQASMAYAAAWAQIQSNPLALVQGWWQFFANYWRFLFVWVPGSLGQFLLPVFAMGLAQLVWRWRNLNNRFLLLCFAGVLLTTPWIFWSANASRAFIATTVLELLIVGRGLHMLILGGQGLWQQASELDFHPTIALTPRYASWLTVGLGLGCLTLLPAWVSFHPLLARFDAQTPSPPCAAPASLLRVDPQLSFFIGLYGDGELGAKNNIAPPNRWNQIRLEHRQFAQHQISPNPIAAAVASKPSATAQLWWVFDVHNPHRYRYLMLRESIPSDENHPTMVCAQPAQRATSKARNTSPPLLWQAVAS